MLTSAQYREKAERYAARRLSRVVGTLGAGKDGTVFQMTRSAAVKIHDRSDAFTQELSIYLRLHECKASFCAGFKMPRLLGFAEDLNAIEMTIVHPPYVVDFASAVLDRPYDFNEDTLDYWHEKIRDQFDDRATDAMYLVEQLGEQFGVYLYDIHRHNIKFRGE
jgi:hypothetical protein